MGGGCFHFYSPADGALEMTRSATEGLACADVLELIGPGTIDSAEDVPSPSASSPVGTLGSTITASIFDASSPPLHNFTSVWRSG
jgi:hypothetical protein